MTGVERHGLFVEYWLQEKWLIENVRNVRTNHSIELRIRGEYLNDMTMYIRITAETISGNAAFVTRESTLSAF
jgi:hypothetical protein